VDKNMKFLIQKDFPTQKDAEEILDIVSHYPYEILDVDPFSNDTLFNLNDKNYIPYCSTFLFETLFKLNVIGLNYNLNTASYEVFTSNRNDMLNNNVYNIKDAIEFLSIQQKGKLWFCKPAEKAKIFTGSVEASEEWVEFLQDKVECKSSGSYKLELDTKLVLDTPKVIYSEYRWFIVDKKIISGSMYKKNGQLFSEEILDRDMTKEAQEFANKWLPNDNCVMDLALTKEGLKVVEFNCINSSGFYKCSKYKVFKALWGYFSTGENNG
jgi:hypothetical protein